MNFIFDANLSFRLTEGLSILETGNDANRETIVTCKHSDYIQELGQGATDQQIIHYAGKTKSIIISQDDDFKRILSNKQLLKELSVGYVLYKPPKHGSRYWDIVESFILGWKKLKQKLEGKEPPYIIVIDKKGNLQEVNM